VLALDQDGRGIARRDGNVVFIEGALPGELVEYQRWRRKPNFDLANLTRVLRESSVRVVPRCPHYELCGGCSLQHLEPRAQVAIKQRVLEDNLARIGKVEPDTLLAPIHGPSWGYRQRARLSVRQVASKGGHWWVSASVARRWWWTWIPARCCRRGSRAYPPAARTDLGVDCRQPDPADRSSDR
jgi:23S rRNA (uracil1939-C5)-methyltransferase